MERVDKREGVFESWRCSEAIVVSLTTAPLRVMVMVASPSVESEKRVGPAEAYLLACCHHENELKFTMLESVQVLPRL